MSEVILETQRLYMKAFEIEDLDKLFSLHGNEEVGSTTIDGVQDMDVVREHLESFIEHQVRHGFSQWAVYLKDGDEFLGRAGLTKRALCDGMDEEVEIRFAILPGFWGVGFASELTECLIGYGRDVLGLDKIVASNGSGNVKSIAVLNKFGFKFVKKVRPEGYGVVVDVDYRELGM
jgi:ribosomal-protein-alanine N-acetyltransferase